MAKLLLLLLPALAVSANRGDCQPASTNNPDGPRNRCIDFATNATVQDPTPNPGNSLFGYVLQTFSDLATRTLH
ncbi:hypothetical protein DSO57_1038475 [Entomophthora muscae]|uniref:Uncharacterized protein n=2 Tax=Entomophthora muscae TaxID=34485 RepID=A0ACC2RP46_9FUNG|nr:hypothetical protein DSO57_1001051 [Entomophthora muscae]KAJ9052009.1 hypothetical protein DSO57_1038475 [Entomophthora muscae]